MWFFATTLQDHRDRPYKGPPSIYIAAVSRCSTRCIPDPNSLLQTCGRVLAVMLRLSEASAHGTIIFNAGGLLSICKGGVKRTF